ncbi:MAG: electron transport complex subunit RsxC [Gammaproteobacteria bacterium]|nr:electron transport complex subunit RsxC [Gammaproteobacteria bacterium]
MKTPNGSNILKSEDDVWRFHGGIKLPGHKAMSTQRPISRMPPSQRYSIPLNQHKGAEGEIIVCVGERVRKGQMLAKPHGLISAAIHAPVSGQVVEIAAHRFPHPSALPGTCIVIENDFQNEWIKRAAVADDYINMSSHDLRAVVRDAGIVGLGGASFPTAVKQTEVGVNTLILNGVECEPYISCDDMLMREHADEIIKGTQITAHIIKAKHCIVAIEDNKPEAIAAVTRAVQQSGSDNIVVQTVPTIYPSGGERQLIKIITGKEVPVNGLPSDIDVLCHNVATCYAIYKAVYEAEPLISRIVTVTGRGVNAPQNLEVSIGTPINECIEHCGGYKKEAKALIMGGPMMGLTLDTDQLPIIKSSNCLLISAGVDITLPSSEYHMPCIRCGNCVDVCPANLLPQQLYWFAASNQYDRAVEYNLFDCIECGCCAYVCPSKIPLVQYYRHAKSDIWEQERERKKADIARERHERRLERLEKQKQERDARLKKKREALAKNRVQRDTEMDKKKALIAEALARVNEKKSKHSIKARNTENLTPEQRRKIKEADARREQMKQQGK